MLHWREEEEADGTGEGEKEGHRRGETWSDTGGRKVEGELVRGRYVRDDGQGEVKRGRKDGEMKGKQSMESR